MSLFLIFLPWNAVSDIFDDDIMFITDMMNRDKDDMLFTSDLHLFHVLQNESNFKSWNIFPRVIVVALCLSFY